MKKILSILIIIFLMPIAYGITDEIEGIDTASIPAVSTSVTAPEAANIRIQRVDYDPTPAEPGEYVDIWISVQNWGQKEIENAYFKLEPEYPFSLNPGDNGIKSFGIIPSFGERLLEYKLKVDEGAIEGASTFKLHLCKDSTCDKYLKTSSLDVTVKTGGSPNILVGLEEFDIFSPGTTGKITLHVVNRGNLDTKFLLLTMLETNEYEIISPYQMYIGELESDDFETAEFKIYIKDKELSSKEIEIPIRYEYSDENNKKYSKDTTLKLRVYSKEDLKKMELLQDTPKWWLAVPILIILGIIYYIYKRYKK